MLMLFSLIVFPSLATAYTWKFDSPPQQCSNLTISVSGSDGKPPYRVLILPFGPSPLANNVEARTIIDQPFPDGASSVNFKLNYPADSQFVAIVSDFSIDSCTGEYPLECMENSFQGRSIECERLHSNEAGSCYLPMEATEPRCGNFTQGMEIHVFMLHGRHHNSILSTIQVSVY